MGRKKAPALAPSAGFVAERCHISARARPHTVLRVSSAEKNGAYRLIDEADFVREIMQRGDALELGASGLRIEALDDQFRVRWVAYYSSQERLLEFAREVFYERTLK